MKRTTLTIRFAGFCLVFLMMGLFMTGTDAAAYKAEGKLTYGIRFKFSAEMIDPGRTQGKTSAWVALYAIHDALLKNMPEGGLGSVTGRILGCFS